MRIYELNKIPDTVRKTIMQRARLDIERVMPIVQEIIDDVRKRGDAALVEYTQKFDQAGFNMDEIIVTEKDVKEAFQKTDKIVLSEMKKQIAYSQKFALAQKRNREAWMTEIAPGIMAGEKATPLDSAGLYIPGGKNPFPTVAQILAVAAKTAGVPRIAACISPKGKNYETIAALSLCGVTEIYRIGGAQAIAALAYGTQTIKPVLKIAGPGNPYVTAAKIAVSGSVSIDMPAGPSEALIIADETANPMYCAADILARLEHGPDSAAVLITISESIAQKTDECIERQRKELSRQKYIVEAMDRYSAILIAENMDEAAEFANEYAPEHLEIMTRQPFDILPMIRNAGSVFLGENNPVAAGDYASGINHILPTGQYAKMYSAVSVETFTKRVQFSYLTKDGLSKLQSIVTAIADLEGLDAHKRSVEIRFRGKNEARNNN